MATVPEVVTVFSRRVSRPENMACGACGMVVGPASAFHPWLYCQLFKAGITNPAGFLEGQHFIPDPAHWGEDAPARQRAAGVSRPTVDKWLEEK